MGLVTENLSGCLQLTASPLGGSGLCLVLSPRHLTHPRDHCRRKLGLVFLNEKECRLEGTRFINAIVSLSTFVKMDTWRLKITAQQVNLMRMILMFLNKYILLIRIYRINTIKCQIKGKSKLNTIQHILMNYTHRKYILTTYLKS